MKRVVITGYGMVSPIGNSVAESWNSILDCKCGIDIIKNFDATDYKVKLAGEVKNINFEEYLEPKEVRINDRFTLFALIAAKEATTMAKLNETEFDHDRFGINVSSGIGGLETIFDNSKTLIEKGNSRISPYFIPKSLINLAAGNLAIAYKANGYVTSVVTACAGATNAIGDAYLRIKAGCEDIIMAGGTEGSVCGLGIAGFQSMKALSQSEDKNAASMPFDLNRKGFVMGEGAGILILEELEHAKKRGATIYAEVAGYGASCDAHHITAPIEDGSMGAKAMINALKDANINASEVGYINAHGTGTYLNDMTETKAIKIAFGASAKDVCVSSTKSHTGHLLGASGAVEAIFACKALETGIIPATINHMTDDPECDLDYVFNENRKKDIKYAMKNSLGFGGHNASVIFKKWGE